METKVFTASVEAPFLAQAKSIQAELGLLVKLLELRPNIVERSKVVSSEDEFGVFITLPNLKSDVTQDIGDPLMYIFTVYEDMMIFRDLHSSVLSVCQDAWLCNIIEEAQLYIRNSREFRKPYCEENLLAAW